MSNNKIPYNPAVLRWAREGIALSKSKAAESLGINVTSLENIEDGSEWADLMQLKQMSKTYNRTLATLLLQTPPKEKKLPKDFRTVDSAEVGHFDPKTIVAIRKARAYASSLLELKKDAGISTASFQLRASLDDKPESVAIYISDQLRLAEMREIADVKIALESYIERVEECGIAVFQLSLTKDNVRGFALIDEEIPVIGIKRGENSTGKIFTLFHELGHILLNVSAITDLASNTKSKIEKWCNAFASAIIIPEEVLKNHAIVRDYEKAGQVIWRQKDLIEIGRFFHAGPLATLRALLTIGRTTRAYYTQKHEQWNKPAFGRSKTPEGRNIPKETIAEKGRTYVALAFKAFDQNRIDLKDLSDYLGVRIKYIPKTRQLLTA